MAYYLFTLYLLLFSGANTFPFAPYVHTTANANSTNLGLNAFPNFFVRCYPPEKAYFSPSSCASIFTHFRSFPDWDTTQEFQEGVQPQIIPNDPTSIPPFRFIDEGEECATVLQARRPDWSDRFSWAQAYLLGLEVVRRCPRNGGFGYIGEERGWSMSISASFREPGVVANKANSEAAVVTSKRRSTLGA